MEIHRLLFLILYFLQGFYAAPPVEVTPERVIILESKPIEVKCRVPMPIAYCRFAVPGVSALSLRPNLPPHEGIQYAGAGFEKGECGILITSVSAKHSGIIQCSMGFPSESMESTGNMTLIVAKPPDPPVLQVATGTTYRDSFMEGETIHASCKIKNARPIANISWFLGSEPVYDKLSRPVSEEENGLFTISQNLTRTVSYVDHGKDLKCVAGHMALGQGSLNHSISKLNVRFPPKPKSQELEKFGFAIGQPGRIVVTFQANPIPDIIWKVDQESLKQGTRDRTGRYEAKILQHKGAGTWDAILYINTVRAEEVEKRYTLIAQNELGQESYKVAISTSPEPPTNITAGAIVGIVIAVLVILLLVFIMIFARATGKWCFAGGVPRPVGESSDTESADHGSTDKSSVSKLTHEKQPKKLMNGLFGSFRKGGATRGRQNRQTDVEFGKNPFAYDHAAKEQQHQQASPQQSTEADGDGSRTEGIVYAELDMARSPGSINVMRRDDDKTEYAEIIYPTSKTSPLERTAEDRRKSRENLVASRENLTEADGSFTTTVTTEGKKEAAV